MVLVQQPHNMQLDSALNLLCLIPMLWKTRIGIYHSCAINILTKIHICQSMLVVNLKLTLTFNNRKKEVHWKNNTLEVVSFILAMADSHVEKENRYRQ